MTLNQIINQLAGSLQPVNHSEPNTIYEIHIINQRYSQQLNVFFEWHRLGRATISRQIGTIPYDHLLDLDQIAQKLTEETQMSVLID
ncbi:hypothetical protein [Convivina intestini]|uniref:Uncharacterized protein n=1 Tax=Convivina intestini TaxID=1505726 RepID=A0A2U1DEW9_9LACO|nr:hypothetical protein [Convivina intestini]PVY86221.1 hypothetical protein C7384_101134 [Convivina intestini]CAH1851337.1 hypothetical protein R077811_00277 [Convivina intestini]CAH1851957.1 hypothetical protein R078131_00384 [Convivina intestini]SDB81609.1 hypothetical protein SAMN05216341_101126 [Leuconostocaceae bacterium R-53105]